MQHMSCSRWFIQAFARAITAHSFVSEQTLEWLREQERLPRVSVAASYEAIARWVHETGDEDLGLRAAALVKFGEGGALDFAMRTASNLRGSVDIASRHARLWSDALEPKLELSESRALVRLDSKLPWPRAAGDFVASVWYAIHIREQLPASAQLEAWFAHSEPSSTTDYERVFEGAKLRFDAPCYGIAFDRALLDRPLLGAEPLLHAAHCRHLEYLQTRLSDPLGFAVQVREFMAYEMRHARPNSSTIARKMHISRRTMVRRLSEEGTTFKAQLDQLRRELARDLIVRPELTLLEISRSLRFSHIQGFHRAFRRWTDETPAQFRVRSLDELVQDRGEQAPVARF